MKLSIGIVGLPNVGKSTLFKLLTAQEITIANYPFATIDPNVGVVPVPDERLQKLTELSHSKKTIPAVVEFYDIAGLVKGANKGEGLGNQFLATIRETQAIAIVLRVFADPDIIHVEQSVDSLRDLEIIKTELILKDLESVEKLVAKTESEARTGLPAQAGKKENLAEHAAVTELAAHLKKGDLPASSDNLMSLIRANGRMRDLNLLTAKKQLYILNGEVADVPPALIEEIKKIGADYLVLDLKNAVNATQHHTNILENVGMMSLIQKSYQILDLVSFFTTGEDETRAWTIRRGTLAPQAAGVIHTDFEHKFIRAEVVAYRKLLEAGNWNQAKQKGFLRLEGKEYVVQDGDVIEVRHG